MKKGSCRCQKNLKNKKIAPQTLPLHCRLSVIISADIAMRVTVLLTAHAETRRLWKTLF